MTTVIEIQVLPHAEGLPLPAYKTAGSSGMDLLAAVESDMEVAAGKIALVPTGLRIATPEGFELQVRPRSGLALNHGIFVINSPGTIDADYRGELKIILANFGAENFRITRGMRIAQLVLACVQRIAWHPVDALPETTRGAGGFGHTGLS
ncbi:MAG TPA: dUTP diphosphatase [Candidatus Sumerlaeota bacterium]|nr:dUTP diphosphatase [Candidatus Sumerlaeota bacterium]